MRMPSISEYLHTLEHPFGMFRTLGEPVAERDVYGKIKFRAGNSSAVFRLSDGRRNFMLKCYIRPKPRLRTIYDYVERNGSPLLPRQKIRPDEIYVYSDSGEAGWYDVVIGDWVEGNTLDRELLRALTEVNRELLSELSEKFDRLCSALLREEWAHGDLKPENIVVTPDGNMTLIDCDALFIPALAGENAEEIGTPGYQHPARGIHHYDKHIDDYPMALLSVGLKLLSLDPSFFDPQRDPGSLPFAPEELLTDKPPAWDAACRTFAEAGAITHRRLLELLRSPDPSLENLERFFAPGKESAEAPLHAFERNGRWGFADPTGKTIVEPLWDDVLDFHEEIAAVRIDHCWHYIDRRGELLFESSGYEAAGSFRNGTAKVRKNGETRWIDRQGNEQPAPEPNK